MNSDREDWSLLPQTLYVARSNGYFTFHLSQQVRVHGDESIRTEFIGRHSGDGHIETFSLAALLSEAEDLYDDADACKRRVEVLAEREKMREEQEERWERERAARLAARSAANQEKAEAEF